MALLLAAGMQVRSDLAAPVADARSRHPDATIELLPPVDEDERLRPLLWQLISDTREMQ